MVAWISVTVKGDGGIVFVDWPLIYLSMEVPPRVVVVPGCMTDR